jgi:acetate kinase
MPKPARKDTLMRILICNAGSTSLKFKLYEMPGETILAEAKMDRVGARNASIFSYKAGSVSLKREGVDIPDYREGIRVFIGTLTGAEAGVIKTVSEVDAVGFKPVIGKGYAAVHDMDEGCIQSLEDYMNVAPVHNRAYLQAIRAFKGLLPDMPMVGVFEPNFHRTIPEEARVYGIPYEWTEKYGLKKYGYHGASHRFVSETAPKLGKAERVISCHLGGSGSICAILHGKSVNNSFGFSLQSGILHANRVGDFDPYAVVFLLKSGMSMDELTDGLVENGGIKGISGVSNDLRDIEEAAAAGNARAQLAIDTFCFGIRGYIGSYYAQLGGLDMLAFTGGIGEFSATVRKAVCEPLAHMGIRLDETANAACHGTQALISAPDSPVKIAVIPANEELILAKEVYEHLTRS